MTAATMNAQAGRKTGFRFLETFGKALNARDTFNELNALNDQELAKRGLTRDGVLDEVVAKLR
jgi:hypothetical protein